VVGPAAEARREVMADRDSSPLMAGASVREVAARLAAAGIRGRLLRGALEALGAARNVAYQSALEHGQDDPQERDSGH